MTPETIDRALTGDESACSIRSDPKSIGIDHQQFDEYIANLRESIAAFEMLILQKKHRNSFDAVLEQAQISILGSRTSVKTVRSSSLVEPDGAFDLVR